MLELLKRKRRYVSLSRSWNYITNKNVRKSVVIWANQFVGGLLLKMPKNFEIMWNIFDFSNVKETVESSLVYVNKVSWIIQSCFLPKAIKQSYWQLLFLLPRTLNNRKTNFSLKSVIVALYRILSSHRNL